MFNAVSICASLSILRFSIVVQPVCIYILPVQQLIEYNLIITLDGIIQYTIQYCIGL